VTSRTVVGVAAIVVVFAVAWSVLMSVRLATNATDVPLYHAYGEAIRHGHVPYRDFPVEYPPAALVPFAVPALTASELRGYRIGFEVWIGVLACGLLAGVAVIAARLGQNVLAPTAFAGAAILALGPISLGHFDLWPALLVEAALAALLWSRRTTAAVLLGLAVAAKVYPVVLLPIGVAWVWRRHAGRAAAAWAAVALAVVAACFLPFFVLAPHGLISSVTGQANRPLQLESSAAAGLQALHQLVSLSIGVGFSHTSVNLAGRSASAAAALTVVLEVLVLLAVWTVFARGRADGLRLVRASTAAVLAFVVLGKVFSPQYLVWLIPLVPLVGGTLAVGASAALGVAVLLTRAYFPGRWIDLIHFETVPTWLLVVRDLVLLVLLAALLARLTRPGLSVSLPQRPTSPARRDEGSSTAQPASPT
jgi:hypothetical protein